MTIINTLKQAARNTIKNTTLTGADALAFMNDMDSMTQPSTTPVLTGADATSFMDEMDALTHGATQRNAQAITDDSWDM